ncbi:unnamed protein product [Macrosiphum euphorbiae]|uniref:Gustatory receptor n=1 Tax=Macrosiphum euphorbiae TaxID=13131 RepID=A0AAV0X8S5_9HEMI|nr:unnamed protein product [Macrosiphum euphorbiae]
MFDINSLIMMCCFEIRLTGKVVPYMCRIFFDNQLSVILTKLEAIHEKLIHLNVIRPMQIKINWLFIILFDLFSNLCECIVFYEYILLVLYIRWMVYIINEQIPQRHSTISTFRDMYLEVIECLNDINTSIYGLPAIWSFIGANISLVMLLLYYALIFPSLNTTGCVYNIMKILITLFNVILLYGIGHATEKEINRMSFVLNQRSMIERNPRIKRQIKFFILRRLHEHFNFELYGICGINLRHLLILLNKATGYFVIQTLFKLNGN